MQSTYLFGAVAAILFATGAYAADQTTPAPSISTGAPAFISMPTPNFDVFGGPLQYKAGVSFASETIWRGISITDHRPGAMAYGEVSKGWFYLGGDVLNVTLPTSPTAQLDIMGGIRPVWGSLTLDFGAVYHGRPGNKQQYFLGGLSPVLTFWTPGGFPTTPFDQSFVEIYGKPSWALNDYLTIGAEIGYNPSWANYNAHALYSGGNAKVSLPGTGLSASGAFGHYFLGMGDATYGPSYIQPGIKGVQGFKLSSYNTWNIGASYKWRAVTFDVRYHDTTLTRRGCFTNVANPAGNFAAAVWGAGYSDWCDARVVGSVNVELGSQLFE